MFGNTTQQSAMGAPAPQSPSMLDNVSQGDFATAPSQPSAPAPATPQAQPPQPITPPITPPPAPTSTQTLPPQTPSTTQQPSGPVTPPQPISTPAAAPAPSGSDDPQEDAQSDYLDAITKEDTSADSAAAPTTDNTAPAPQTPAAAVPDMDELSGMKKQALEHLEPLVKHLEQTPEDEFRTTMMMIQANDNHTLIEKALKAAKSIEDDQKRAQAMLDIINEINYFSQSSDDN